MYIHELSDWPRFQWILGKLAASLASVRHRQGWLAGHMEALRIAPPRDANDSERLLEAGNFHEPLTSRRLLGWHASLFPAGRFGWSRSGKKSWRDDRTGPAQVLGGPAGGERILFEAPKAERLEEETRRFLGWFEGDSGIDPVLKAGLAHFWFVTIRPFDDGNGRIARAIADLALARCEKGPRRFYSMSAQVERERDAYYDILERTQKGTMDITPWMEWFLGCLGRALDGARDELGSARGRAVLTSRPGEIPINDRQRLVVNRLLEGSEGKITSSRYAKLVRCSQDTAHRDILFLLANRILARNPGGGRSTSYRLAAGPS